MYLVRNIFSMLGLGMAATVSTNAHATVAGDSSWSAKTPSSERKRKLDVLRSPENAKKTLFPLFSPSLSPNKSIKSSGSPSSSSPSRKKANLTIKQGAAQHNKILRYLQPKRLLTSFESREAPSGPSSSLVLENVEHDKENAVLDVRVSLVRIDEDTFREHSYCIQHRSPKKYCCNAASEYVVQKLGAIVNEDARNPCKRLGISEPVCVTTAGCCHFKDVGVSSSYQDSLFVTMVDADLLVMMIRACCQDLSTKACPSPSTIHAVFRIMQDSADKNIVALARSFLKRAIDCHPPCSSTLRMHYIKILHSPEFKVSNTGLWSLRTLDFFEATLAEVESHVEGLLNPSQLKGKLKTPGIRKIKKPKRFLDSPSPVKKRRRRSRQESEEIVDDIETNDHGLDNFSDEAIRKRQLAEEAMRSMSATEKTDHIFSRFEILVQILEWDLIVWLKKNDLSKIRDRAVCPLVVLALWTPESDTGYDSVHCRRIFSMYASAWILKFHPRHIRTLSRLIGLIAEITSASEPNFGNVYPHVGDGCENLSRKLSDALKNSQVEETKAKAVSMIKPDWLKMLVSANFLGVSPTLSSLDLTTLAAMSDHTDHLWVTFVEAVMEFYHVTDAMHLLKQASQGSFKKDLPSQDEADGKICKLNYKALLHEIQAYYCLSCQIDECDDIGLVPYLIRGMLTIL